MTNLKGTGFREEKTPKNRIRIHYTADQDPGSALGSIRIQTGSTRSPVFNTGTGTPYTFIEIKN